MRVSTQKTLKALAVHSCLFHWLLGAPAPVHAETDNDYLDMDLAQLMQVSITSVSKKNQNLADTAAAAYVITQEDIRRAGVTTIPEALAMAPGIQVARIDSNKWSISSRGFAGFTANKLLVMIDGRSVYTPAFSGTYWDMQHTLLEDIDRIEVIRGPGATIWGANAVNGVINIITKKAQDTQGTLLRAGAGDQEQTTAAARYGGKIGEAAFGRFYVTGNDRDSNVLAVNGQDANDGWQNVQGGFRLDGTVGGRNEWNLQGDLFKNDGDQISYPYWLKTFPFLAANRSDFTSSGDNLTGSWKHRLTGGDLLSFNAYYDHTTRQESIFEQHFNTVDLNLQYETSLGDRNSLTMGTGFRRIEGDFTSTDQIDIPDQSRELYNVFLQDEIKLIADHLWFTAGTKYENNTYSGSEWQPSARLLWKPAADHSLWTSVARAVRTPSMIENSGSITVGVIPTASSVQAVHMRGDSDFNSETLNAYEAGYRWQAMKNLSLDMAVYFNDYESIYTTLPRPATGSFDQFFVNAKEGEGHGAEAAVNWKTSPWLTLFFTYSWQELDLHPKDPSLRDQNADFTVTSTPKNQASVRSAVDITENWQLNCWLRYVDASKGRNTTDPGQLVSIPSYFLLDANLIWKPMKGLEVMLAGQNLLQDSQLEYVSELITPPTEIKRGVFGKVTWSF